MDCEEGLKYIDTASVSLIIVDPPYGKTHNKWDKPLDFSKLWNEISRVLKPDGVAVIFGMGIFSAQIIMSNQSDYRYTIIWKKTQPSGFLNASRRPMCAHEDMLVFYKKQPTYNPQKTYGHKRKVSKASHKKNCAKSTNYNSYNNSSYDSTERYPTDVVEFATDKQKSPLHPTQKPIELLRWLIRTYSNPGDLVLDFCCGSGSTLVAAEMEERRFLGFDNGMCEDEHSANYGKAWADIAADRLETIGDYAVQLSFFGGETA